MVLVLSGYWNGNAGGAELNEGGTMYRAPTGGEARNQAGERLGKRLGLAAVDRWVADVLALDDVDYVLRDVGGVVADAFEIFGYED